MKLLTIQEHDNLSGFELFLSGVSCELSAVIYKKLHAYSDANEIYASNSLKLLKPKIWGFKGTIYKLRVDCGKESARILFTKTPQNDIVLLHGFVKKTQKTPKKDARVAKDNLERVKSGVGLRPWVMTS
jgi:phage-related protein